MYCSEVSVKNMFVLKHSRATVTLEGLHFTNIMYCWQVLFQGAFLGKLPAANLALVSGVRMLWSAVAAAVSVRGVVVSADRWLVVERHVTDLTLDATRGPNLQTQSNTTVDNGLWCVVARMISINDFAVVLAKKNFLLLEHMEKIKHLHTRQLKKFRSRCNSLNTKILLLPKIIINAKIPLSSTPLWGSLIYSSMCLCMSGNCKHLQTQQKLCPLDFCFHLKQRQESTVAKHFFSSPLVYYCNV